MSRYDSLCEHGQALWAAYEGSSLVQHLDRERMADPVLLVKRLVDGGSSLEFARGVLNRHRDVQHSNFARHCPRGSLTPTSEVSG